MTTKSGVVAQQNPPKDNDGGNSENLDTPLVDSNLASINHAVTGLNDRASTTTNQLVIGNHEKRPDGSETVTSASTTTTTVHENAESGPTNPPSDPDGPHFIILMPRGDYDDKLPTYPGEVFGPGMTSTPNNLPEGLLTPDRDLLWDGIALCIQKVIDAKLIRDFLAFMVAFLVFGTICVNLLSLIPGISDGVVFIVLIPFMHLILPPLYLKLSIFLNRFDDDQFRQIANDLSPFLRSTAGVDITYHVQGDAGRNFWVDKTKRYYKLSRYNPDIDQNNNTNVTDNTATTVPAPLWPLNREYPSKSDEVVLRLIGMGTLPLYPPALKGHTDINLFAWAHLYHTIMRVTWKFRSTRLLCYGLIGFFLWILSFVLMIALDSPDGALVALAIVPVLLVLFWRYQMQTFYTSQIREFWHKVVEKAAPAFTRSCGYGVVLETKPGMLFGTVLYVRMYPLNNNDKGNNGSLELV